MKVSEIFYSLQGEGVHQGSPTLFIRLAGCNLPVDGRCSYCDTVHAQDVGSGRDMSMVEVLQEVGRVAPYPAWRGWICITGGEPLHQPHSLRSLVVSLHRRGFKIEVETNGTLMKPVWWKCVTSWCVDVKCPSSAVVGKYREEWTASRVEDQLKFVVGTEADLLFVNGHLLDKYLYPTVLISPVFPTGSGWQWDAQWVRRVAEFCKDTNTRLSLQLHKLLWDDEQGV